MKMPIFASSYQVGSGLESKLFQSGVYCPYALDMRTKLIRSCLNERILSITGLKLLLNSPYHT